jgi:hypothetical protein
MNNIEKYLKISIKFAKKCNRSKIGSYTCIEEFVYRNGQLFTNIIFPENLIIGKMKECYKNAALLCMENKNYFYVEGYACGIIPVMHAWCIDKDKNVIDPTWNDGGEYFGIIIKKRFLMDSLVKKRVFGLIDDWSNGWELLRLNPEIWKEVINGRCRKINDR